MDIIGFNNGTATTSTNVTVTKKTATAADLMYTTSTNIPDAADKSVLTYTTDTGEFYIGQGVGVALKKISTDNIVFADTKDDLPTTGQSKTKLYIAIDTKTIYLYTDNGYAAISSGATIDPAVITTIQTNLLLKADKAALVAYRLIANKIAIGDLDSTVTTILNSIPAAYNDAALKLIIAAKADETELSNYRAKADAIKETDLDPILAAKIDNAGSGSSGGTSYNDTAIKADITELQNDKADKSVLSNYRAKADAIVLADLDGDLSTSINNKADKTDLTGFRKTADKIIESDLDGTVITKLNAVGSGSGVQIYDYEAVNSVNGEALIRATGPGVSLSKGTAAAVGGGTTTYPMKILTPPAGVKILSARIRFLNTEISTSGPGCAVDWNATQSDNTDNSFNEPLCNVWNDAIGNRTLRSCAQSNSLNNHTITFTGLAAGGDTGVGALVKLIY